MKHAVVIVPGSIETRTGGYEYDRRIVDGLRARGWTIDVRELSDTFPHPTPSALEDTAKALAAIPDRATVLVDGLAFGAMPDQIEREAARLSFVPIVHALLASEIGLDGPTASRLEGSERCALVHASRIVVAGTTMVFALAAYGIAPDRIHVVEPGTDPAPLARGSGQTGVVHLVTVATLNPGKGHAVLLRALARLKDKAWRLTCAGSTTRHPATTSAVRSILKAERLEDRVDVTGELDAAAVAAVYDSADLFVLPTLIETHPLSVGEALARGLPVISTRTGAIPDLIGADAGMLVAPGDVDALTHALAAAIDDADLRARLAAGARRVRERLPTWEIAVENLERVIR